jgi:hypothetical protein
VTHGVRGWDFYALYQAGHNVLTGHSAYQSDGAAIEVVIPGGTYTPFRYLPLSAYTLGALLNLVPPRWAYRLWVGFVEVLLLACIALTWRTEQDPDKRARQAAMWLLYMPFYLELYMGQFSFVQGALVFLMLVLGLGKRLGLPFDLAWVGSVLWKQNTALFLPLMVRLRRWRALVLLVLLLVLTAAPYFALVPGSLAAFLGNLRSETPWFQLGNLGFRQLVFDAQWSLGDVLGIEWPARSYEIAQWSVVAFVVGVGLALLLLDPRPNVVLHLCLWMTAYFLIYHHVWEHHYVMLLPILVALMHRPQTARGPRESPLLWVLYALLALPTPFAAIDPHGQVAILDAMRWTPIRPLWQDLWYHSAKALPTLLLYGWLAWGIAQPILAEWRAGQFTLWPLRQREQKGP